MPVLLRPCIYPVLKQPGASDRSTGSVGLCTCDVLCSIGSYLQMVVAAVLPLCIAVSNLHTLQSGDTGLHALLHRPMSVCTRQSSANKHKGRIVAVSSLYTKVRPNT